MRVEGAVDGGDFDRGEIKFGWVNGFYFYGVGMIFGMGTDEVVKEGACI